MKLGRIEVCYIAPVNCKQVRGNYYRFAQKASALIAVCLTNIQVCMAASTDKVDPLKRMDEGGEKLVEIGQRIGYWVCILMCIFEIIKKVKDGDTNAIWGILMKYGIAYGSLFGVKWVLDMIGGFFS